MTNLRERVRPIPAGELEAMQLAADQAIENLRAAYLTASHDQIDRLQQLIDQPAPHDEAWRTEIYRIAHDLKGQGTTFGHELVTKIAASLCQLIRKNGTREDPHFTKPAQAHCEALDVILTKDIRGLGGEHGAELLRILSIEA